MEKMKIDVGTIAALVLVAVVVSTLGISFGIVQADEEVEAEVEAKLRLGQTGTSVYVEVEAKGLAGDTHFTVRAYKDTVTDCSKGPTNAIGKATEISELNGNFEATITIAGKEIDDVGSVSIRDDDGTGAGPIVVCFQNTTP